MRDDLPSGTATFLFTDVEGSTRLLHELGAEAYADALAEHRRVIREACVAEGGVEVDTQGDAFFFAFPSAPGAAAAAASFTQELRSGPISVRVGLHTGQPLLGAEGYVGDDVHFAARVAATSHGGQVVLSAATAELVDQAALTSLGSHRLKDISEPVSVYQLGEGSFPPLKTIANSNLPTPAWSFLGREDELYEADALLRSTRLLTIAGPGGQGKTRFALELARRAREERFSDYPDGVFSSFLASLREPSLVLPTIAQTVNVKEQPGRSALDALSNQLQGKRMLLLIDNAEHLLDAASELSQLLRAAEGLTLLVTSRELLRIQGETPYSLPPLQEDEGIALFCERARLEPSEDIAELCLRLEGLPLAIELAAARTAILTPRQLLERLSQRLDLLKGFRDADPRQQTLRATIEWSYDLLSPEEQELFARLSVFQGGCTLEAAEEVCDAGLDSLQSLVDKSLLRFSEERFWMLETIREYAGERLEEVGELETTRDFHANYFLAVAERNEPPRMFLGRSGWLDVLKTETDNIRAADDRLAARPDPVGGFRLIGALFRFWLVTGLVREGLERTERALARADPEWYAELRIKLLYAATICAPMLGDSLASRRYDEESLALARHVGDTSWEAIALNDLGLCARDLGEFESAEWLFRQSQELAQSIGDDETVAVVTSNRAELALVCQDYVRAEALSARAAALAEAADDPWQAVPRCVHAYALLGQGTFDQAARELADILEETLRAHGPIYAVEVLDGLAAARVESFPMSASRLFGAVDEARGQGGFVGEGAVTTELVTVARDRCRDLLGDEIWNASVAEGAQLALEDAVAYALATPAPSGK